MLGNLAHNLDTDISKVVKKGPGLTFMTYPEAISNLPVPQLLAVLFFLMFVTLGLGTATGIVSNIVSVICDNRPSWNKPWVTAAVCALSFLIGLIYITPVSTIGFKTSGPRADFTLKSSTFCFYTESYWVDSVISALAKILLMSSFTTFITIVVKKYL